MIENKLDVTELPVAETVKAGDQLLLVRPNGDGTKTAMRIEGQRLKQTKVKKKVQNQYVIGRAVRPRACDQGHMVNWYLFGSMNNGNDFVVIIPVIGKVVHNQLLLVEKAYIKYEYDSENRYLEMAPNNTLISPNGQFCIYRFSVEYYEMPLDYETPPVFGIRVDKYEEGLDGRFRAVWLSWRCVPRNIKTASTHHWFEGGYRQYRPINGDRQFLADNINFDEEIFSNFFGLKYEAIICKKMRHFNSPGEGDRKRAVKYFRTLIFKRLRFSPDEDADVGEASHAKKVGGLYRAIPIYSICKTKGRPVYFYVRRRIQKLSNDNRIIKRCIEWK